MARLPRYFIKNHPQHIIVRGNNRADIFGAEEDYRFYLECLQDAAERHQLSVHAYVLMSNHVHLLASPKTEDSIPKTLQSIGRRYVQYFNYIYTRTGTLWEGRYRATVIDTESYLLTCMRYIELNPVRARNMVEHPKDYPWSSYQANAHGQDNALVSPHNIYQRLGKTEKERQAAYRALFRSRLEERTLNDIRSASNKGWALGDKHFQERVAKVGNRRAAPKPRGRPALVD